MAIVEDTRACAYRHGFFQGDRIVDLPDGFPPYSKGNRFEFAAVFPLTAAPSNSRITGLVRSASTRWCYKGLRPT